MNKANLGNDLFLLMINLSQIVDTERVKKVFIEALGNLFQNFQFEYASVKEEQFHYIPIQTDRNNYGFIRYSVDEEKFNQTDLSFIRNAISMLSVIFENHYQRSLLSDEKKLLQSLVEERTEELTRINEELQTEIEERQQAEEQIFFQASLLEEVHNAVIVTDLEFKITYWNKYATELYHWKKEETLGKLIYEVTVPKARLDEASNALEHIKKEGSWQGEFEVQRKDGSSFIALVSNSLIHDSLGKAIGIVGVSSDITELRESEIKRKILMTQLKGRIKELQCLYELSKIVQKPKLSLDGFLSESVKIIPTAFPEESLYSVRLNINDDIYESDNFTESKYVISQKITINGEYWGTIQIYSHRDESSKNLLHPLKDYFILLSSIKDYIVRFIERIIFISELQLEKERVGKANQIKMNLLSNMNHEIRTPLSGILGYAAYLSENLREERFKEMASHINISGQRLLNTLNSVIDLSKLSSETSFSADELTEIDLNAFIRETVRKHENNVIKKGLTLSFKPYSEEIMCTTKKSLLELALDNIIDNAIKFTNQGAIGITLEPDKNKESILLKVKDTGIGIPKQHHKIIFEPFRQVSEGYGRSFEGVGLGLSITKRIAELLGLDISIDSDIDKGSVFQLHIPLTNTANRKQKRQNIMETNGQEINTKMKNTDNLPKVLLVEDNAINQDVVSLYLTDICKVESAANAINALQMLKQTQYKLILMDINLGVGMNGVDLTKELKKMQNYKDTPVLAVTGYALPEDKDHLLSQGIDYYLAKPFNREQLVSVIQEIFANA